MSNDGTTLWAWVTREPNGSVSQVGFIIEGLHMALTHRERSTVEKMRPMARQHAVNTGQRVWLRAYTQAVDYEDA